MSPEQAYLEAVTRGEHATARNLEHQIESAQLERETRLNAPGALLSAALWYAANGVAVFPCQPGGKRPATPNGFKNATTDTDQIHAWWRVNPHYNLGAPTGITFDVIDVDSPRGLLALGDLLDADPDADGADIYTQLGAIGLAFTPRGRHYYVPPDPDAINGTNLVTDVDYRAAGGYVVIPPSRAEQGTYRWSLDRPLTPGAA